jgi:putrescine transport system substrate-binding protein
VYGVALHYLGLDPNTHNPKDYDKATDYLVKLRPYITYFSNSNYIFDLASGNICIVMGYSGDVMRAKHYADMAGNGVHIAYVVPKSGAPIWFDMMAIPRDAPHPQAAEAFMNYLISPKVAATLSNFVFQPNATPSSAPYLKPDLRDPNVTPDAKTISRLFEPLVPPNDLNQYVNRLWLEVRYGIRD